MIAWGSKPRRRLGATLSVAAALLLGTTAWPVIGQEAPRSILPDIFRDAEPPPPAPIYDPAPRDAAEDVTQPADGPPAPGIARLPARPDPLSLPPLRARTMERVGWLTPAAGGYGPRTFSGSDGRFLAGLMRRVDAPIASRWAHIVLRRALLSVVPTPSAVRPADWVAERAWLLLRLGEIDGAKMLISDVPIDRYTPRLYAVAGQVHLAAADMPALCPLSQTAATLSPEPLWQLANAMCASFEGDDITAATILNQLRAREAANPFDIVLAERIVSSTSGGSRAANIEWDDVSRLTTYRFGLASAGGATIPPALIASAKPGVAGWQFRMPSVPAEDRLSAGLTAAALGISSAAEMVSLYAAQGATLDPGGFESSAPGRLRAAFVARVPEDRVTAMRTLWRTGTGSHARYGNLVLTARAAARLPVSADHAASAHELVASMLSAGYDKAAMRWLPVILEAPDEVRDAAWAMLAVADAGQRVEVTPARFSQWYEREQTRRGTRARHRAQLLFAALEGLGKTADDSGWNRIRARLELAPLDNIYTHVLGEAARDRRIGAVALLAAIGMQTDWRAMPPQYLAHILAAYHRVGLDAEARMLAAEAMTRS